MFIPLLKPILRIAGLILSLIIYALTILAAYGGRFDTEIFTIPAILTLTLPYLAWATVIITIAWLCLRKIFTAALGVLTIIASWGPVSTVSPVASSKSPTPGSQTFTLMTYNMIHGWDLEDKGGKSNRTVKYILDSGCDIVCLQEAMRLDSKDIPLFTEEQQDSMRKIYPYRAGTNSLDTKVLSKYPVTYVEARNYIDGPFDPRRYTFYKLDINGKSLTLINIHLQSFMLTTKEKDVITSLRNIDDFKTNYREIKGDLHDKMKRGFRKRKEDVQILRNAIDRIEGPLIICGDFNDVPESYAYRLLMGDDLRDAYVETSFGPLITYNRHAFYFHLDQIFYRGYLRALSVEKGKIKASDHYPLIAEFEFTER